MTKQQIIKRIIKAKFKYLVLIILGLLLLTNIYLVNTLNKMSNIKVFDKEGNIRKVNLNTAVEAIIQGETIIISKLNSK